MCLSWDRVERTPVGGICLFESQEDAFLRPTSLRNLFILFLKNMVTFSHFPVKHEEFKTDSYRRTCLDNMSEF